MLLGIPIKSTLPSARLSARLLQSAAGVSLCLGYLLLMIETVWLQKGSAAISFYWSCF